MFGYSNQTYQGTPNPYTQFANNYYGNTQTPVQAPSQQNNTGSFMAVFVNGENEVNNYPVAPGLTVMLIDFNLKKFWLKSTGMNGVPQPLRTFPFEEETAAQANPSPEAVSREEFNALNSKLDKLISELGGAK